jgi:hypothetical protein
LPQVNGGNAAAIPEGTILAEAASPTSGSEADDRQRLVAWFEQEFVRRTLAIRRGEGSLGWVPVEARVSWSEVQHQSDRFGINLGGIVDARTWWHEQRDWERWTKRTDGLPTVKLEAMLAKLDPGK